MLHFTETSAHIDLMAFVQLQVTIFGPPIVLHIPRSTEQQHQWHKLSFLPVLNGSRMYPTAEDFYLKCPKADFHRDYPQ